MESPVAVDRERDLERFLTFVDAMVAIAITLLVLPLVDLVAELHDGSVGDLLGDHLAELGAFLLSFAVIARLWYAQHRAVRHLRAMNGWIYLALMAWALTIVFLPFPTALVAQRGSEDTTKLLYIGTTALSLALLAWLDWLLRRFPTLSIKEGAPDLERALLNTGLNVVALVVAVAVPPVGYYALLLQTLDGPLARLRHRLRGGGVSST